MDILAQLKKLPLSQGLVINNERAWIKCVWHKEKTPSLAVNITPGKYPLGSFYCFGCSEHGNWNKLATKLGMQENLDVDSTFLEPINFSAKDIAPQKTILPPGAIAWNKYENWRNIEGQLLVNIGSQQFFNPKISERQIFFPISVNHEIRGGINANIIPRHSGPNYFNTKFAAKTWGLFPYDYTAKKKAPFLALVEGPRDSLNLIQQGLPALAILGSAHACSVEKFELIMALEPQTILLAFDNDEAGNKATEIALDYFDSLVRTIVYEFPKGKIKIDASDLTKFQVQKIVKYLEMGVLPKL